MFGLQQQSGQKDGLCLNGAFGSPPFESVSWTLSWQEASILDVFKTMIR